MTKFTIEGMQKIAVEIFLEPIKKALESVDEVLMTLPRCRYPKKTNFLLEAF